jgi:hypothetical protein
MENVSLLRFIWNINEFNSCFVKSELSVLRILNQSNGCSFFYIQLIHCKF